MIHIKFKADPEKFQHIDTDKPVVLLEVFLKNRDHMSDAFLKFDSDDNQGFQSAVSQGNWLVLLFSQGRNVFTSMRKFTPPKAAYYFGLRGSKVMVQII